MTINSPDRPLTAILLMAGATLVLVAMDASIKWLVAGYPLSQILFMRTVVGLVPTLLFLWLTWSPGVLRIRSFQAHALRIGCSLFAMYAFFTAIGSMELAAIVSIGLAAPILITLFSTLFLGERVGWRRWAAVTSGFIGVIIIIQPSPGGLAHPIALLALLGTVGHALSQIFTRRYAASETASAMLFYMTLAVILVTGLLALPVWKSPAAGDLPVILFAGLCYGAGFIMMTLAYRYAQASLVAPFDYMSLLWAIIIGFMVWQEIPSTSVLTGGAIIAMSGIFILRRRSPGPDRGGS